MKKTSISLILLLITMTFSVSMSAQKKTDPWTEKELIQPSVLAEILQDSSQEKWPLIIAVNPDGMFGLPFEGGIEGSLCFGPAEDEENLNDLREFLQERDREEAIVLYCGCCPFHMCPNIRPAFKLLNEMGFSQHKLLNLPKNLKDNWMLYDYPMKGE